MAAKESFERTKSSFKMIIGSISRGAVLYPLAAGAAK
jgi:hypothetical protein